MHTPVLRTCVRRHSPFVYLTLALSLLVGPLADRAVAQPAAAASWSFEETSGSIIESLTSLLGSLANGATRITSGKSGRGLRTDGANDYVNLGDSSVIESGAFSVAVWFKRNGTQPDWARLANKGNPNAAPWGTYKLEFDGSSDTVLRFHVGFTDNSMYVAKNTVAIPDNTWTHVVGAYSPSLGWIKIFINGVLQATTTVPGGKTLKFDSTPLTIGGTQTHSYFKGDLDEVRYYNYALGGDEVMDLYNASAAAAPPPSGALTVTSPNTAVTWALNSVQSINWNHSLGSGTTSKVELSTNGGSSWTQLAASVANGSSSGSYSWTVGGTTTSSARIRVSSSTLADTSDTNFTIAAGSVTVNSPNASSEVWTVGQNANVTWSGNLGPSENVKLELSTNGGSTYPIVLASSTPNDGNQAVSVQSGWVTSAARVRVSWLRDSSKFDVSNLPFTIDNTSTAQPKQVTFQSTTLEFPNPDRGFYVWVDPATNYAYLSPGVTLVHEYFMMDAYRSVALPSSFLSMVDSEFDRARSAGMKMIPRFTYNFSMGAPDATRSRIEQHIGQLAPIWAANQDVISSVEAGFIGSWGEWHTSTNGLENNLSAKDAILTALLNAVPQSRQVQLRYPLDMQLLNGPPITPGEAFSGSDRSRVGSHQDCFLASANDWGTWARNGVNTIAYDKAYIAENGKYAVVGGETCNPNPPRSSCPTALDELEYLHFSNLNLEYHATVIQGFKNGGCYDEIRRRLGYRYELVSATYVPTVQRGTTLPIDVSIRNVGFAAMFNERPVFAVLSNGTQQYMAQLSVDPREWAAGSVSTWGQTIALPASMPTGTYRLSLWLPDDASSIRNDTRYAVRFANVGTWDSSTGQNILATDIVVTP
jgi:hypothetical protein